MQKQQVWPFSRNKQFPYSIVYNPNLIQVGQEFMNPFLGYPNCPLIGRYNQGEYRIAQTICHLQFQCKYDQKQGKYKCGSNLINLPNKMLYNLRNIPDVIKHNKSPNQGKNKKIQDSHPFKFPILNQLKFIFVITFGQLGKDFLNYLNHMYTLGHQLFIQQKLRRSAYLLPIYAYLPQKSGIMHEEVDKGLSLDNYRSEYLSLHLKYGAPAFSPNNMRLGIEGMKKIISNPQSKKNKNSRDNYKNGCKGQQQHNLDNFVGKSENKKLKQWKQKMDVDLFDLDLKVKQAKSQVQDRRGQQVLIDKKQKRGSNSNQVQITGNKQPDCNESYNNKSSITTQPFKHKGFIHFYTSVLLVNDYRIYYHWHQDKQQRRQTIQASLQPANSMQQFLVNCADLIGYEDECIMEAFKIFSIKV